MGRHHSEQFEERKAGMKLLLEKMLHLRSLYVDQVRSMLSAEEQIAEWLERLRHATVDGQLELAFQLHLQRSQAHADRLRQILNQTAGKAEEKKCKAIAAMFAEAESLVEETDRGPVRDAALISVAQRVNHYQIAVYGALRSYARLLELSGEAEMLERILRDEAQCDEELTQLSGRVNHGAFELG
jgi:ferritin-like metal-binding protein YciE